MYIEFLNSFSINTLKYESCRNMSKKLLIGISTMFPEFYFCLQEVKGQVTLILSVRKLLGPFGPPGLDYERAQAFGKKYVNVFPKNL